MVRLRHLSEGYLLLKPIKRPPATYPSHPHHPWSSPTEHLVTHITTRPGIPSLIRNPLLSVDVPQMVQEIGNGWSRLLRTT